MIKSRHSPVEYLYYSEEFHVVDVTKYTARAAHALTSRLRRLHAPDFNISEFMSSIIWHRLLSIDILSQLMT